MQRILILADNREDIKELTNLLQDHYEVVVAGDLREAAGQAEKIPPDLVVADLALAGQNDPAGGTLGAARPESAAPVLFIIDDRAQAAAQVFSLGGRDYIARPFIAQEVRARLQLQLELRQARQALRECADSLELKNRQLQEAFEQFDSVARIDLLTDLPNRHYMVERMKDEVARAFRNQRPLAVIMADIDGFKAVRDTYGPEAGDYVLQKMADMMRSRRRGQDVVARWGPDVFLLMLPETYLPDAGRVAERIRSRVENWDIGYAGKSFRVTITMGVAEFDAEWGLEGLIGRAENAVKQGKKLAKNCVVLSSK